MRLPGIAHYSVRNDFGRSTHNVVGNNFDKYLLLCTAIILHSRIIGGEKILNALQATSRTI